MAKIVLLGSDVSLCDTACMICHSCLSRWPKSWWNTSRTFLSALQYHPVTAWCATTGEIWQKIFCRDQVWSILKPLCPCFTVYRWRKLYSNNCSVKRGVLLNLWRRRRIPTTGSSHLGNNYMPCLRVWCKKK